MATATLYSLSALAGIIAGICIFVGTVLNDLVKKNGAPFNFLGALIGLFGITGVFLWQRNEAGTFGVVAYVVVFIGLALIACTDYAGTFIIPNLPDDVLTQLGNSSMMRVMVISFTIFLVGEIAFGISTIMAGVFSTITAVMFMIGFLATPLRPVNQLITFIGLTLSSAALIWWGVSLWTMAGGI
ncbi:MAG: hypothetical protein JSV37_07075 [Anaerolineaceae bacterium]|nr:MAG: hypothetical protein JSV37_07075 [Anaerolineaceae bacterium]